MAFNAGNNNGGAEAKARGQKRLRRALPFKFFLLTSASFSILPLSFISAQSASAAIVGTESGMTNTNGIGTRHGTTGGFGAEASQNSIALVGDGDCTRLSGKDQAAGSGILDPLSIWGDGDDKHTNGIYGFGEQKLPTDYGNVNANKGPGMRGYRPFNDQKSGRVDGNLQSTHSYDYLNQAIPGGGARTLAYGVNANAIGCDARANGFGAQAMGWSAWASGAGSVAFGINSRATGQGALAFGIYAQATGEDSIAQGALAKASDKGAIAIGALTAATGKNSIAIGGGDAEEGTGAQAAGYNSVSLGRKASASQAGSVALGSESAANRESGADGYDPSEGNAVTPAWHATRGAVAVGNDARNISRQITGVAAGSEDTDAANVAQLKSLKSYTDGKFETYVVDSPIRRLNKSDELVLVGPDGDASNPGAAQKLSNVADGADKNEAVNFGQLSASNDKIAANSSDIAANKKSIADNLADANTRFDTVNKTVTDNKTAADKSFGEANDKIAANSSDIAANSKSIADNLADANTRFDTVNKTVTDNKAAADKSFGEANDKIAANSKSIADNLADANTRFDTVNKTVTDNKAALDNAVSNTNAYLGGGADIAAGAAPTFTVQGRIAKNVADAFGNVDTAFNTVNTTITNNKKDADTKIGDINTKLGDINTNITNGSVGPVRRAASGNNLVLVGKSGDAANPGAAQKLSNVADGYLSITSTEAVNGRQLTATNENVSKNAAGIADNKKSIADNKTEAEGKFTKIDTKFGDIDNSITNITNGNVGSVRRAGDDTLVLVAKGGDATNPGAAQKLTNVAKGSVSATSTHAVNGAQLFGVESKVNTNAANIANNTQNIINNKSDADTKFGDINTSINNINNSLSNNTIGPVRRFGSGDNLVLVGKGGTADAPGAAQKLSNVADGYLSITSTEAVNGRQLNAANEKISQNTGDIADTKSALDSAITNTNKFFGGGTNITSGYAPAFTVQGKSADNVTDAFKNVDTTFNTVNSTITNNKKDADTKFGDINTKLGDINTNITNGSVGPVRRMGDGDNLVLVAKGGDAAKPGAAQKITNLADGSAKNDAVNFGQLSASNDKIAANSSDIAANKKSIADNLTDANSRFDTVNKTVTDNKAAADKSFGEANDKITQNSSDIAANKTDITANKTALDNAVKNTNAYLGGGADIAAGKAPAFTVQGKSANNVADAFGNVDSAFTEVNSTITNNKKDADTKFGDINTKLGDINTNITNGSVGPVRRMGDGDNLVLVAKGGDAAKPGAAQKITNLADGSAKNDAVNFGQLSASNDKIAANSKSIADNLADANSRFDTVNKTVTDNKAAADKSFGEANDKITQNSSDIAANKTDITANKTALDNAVKNTNAYLGGGADIAAGKAPAFTVQGKSANNVAEAFGNVDSAFTEVNSTITNNKKDADTKIGDINTKLGDINTNITNGSVGPVRRMGDGDNLVLVAKGGDAAKPGAAQKITNLADGSAKNDAVNFGQLSASNDKIAANSKSIADNLADANSRFDTVNKNMTANNQQIASYLGGGAAYQNGAFTPPSYAVRSIDSAGKVSSAKHNNVGDALGAMDKSLGNVNSRVDSLDKTVKDEIGKAQENGIRWNDDKKAYDAAGKGNSANKITNIANGDISAASKDAVTGGQLFETNQRVGNVENRVGNVESRIDKIGAANKNAVIYDTDSSGNRKNSLTLQGADPGQPVAIHNVAEGKVAKNSKDAVNGGQLQNAKDELKTTIADKANETLKNANAYTDSRIKDITGGGVEEANRYTDMQFGKLNGRIHQVRKEARAAAAIGLSAASLRFDDTPGKASIGLGGGYWKGQGAVSFGAGYTSETGRFRSNVTGTMANGSMGVGAGVTIRLN